jgi:phospholipid transport system substrate-binding protein
MAGLAPADGNSQLVPNSDRITAIALAFAPEEGRRLTVVVSLVHPRGGRITAEEKGVSTPMTLPSRTARLAGLCLAVVFAVGLFAPRTAAALDPQETVRSFYAVLLDNMREGRMLGESGRYARLAPVVDRTFDIPSMTRLAVGPYWATLNPSQQQQLVTAFAHYVAATYADEFDTYSGEQLQVTGARPYGADVMVQTKIVKSNGESTQLDYLMRQNQSAWQVSDVYLGGSISQLAVHRSEFHSILQRQGVDALVLALNRKTDLLKSVAKSS